MKQVTRTHMDHLSKEDRSRNMRAIKSKNTMPELIVRSLLHKEGLRFRLHKTTLPGKPDIVLPKYKTVIFINGCFWHRHEGCRDCTTPKTNTTYWSEKFSINVDRDKKKIKELELANWRVIIIWECELKDIPKLRYKLLNILHIES